MNSQNAIVLSIDLTRSLVLYHTAELSKRESSTPESLGNIEDSKPDKEMQEWISSIMTQNQLLPNYLNFDNKRHLSMRSKYADTRQTMRLCNVLHEMHEEHVSASSRDIQGLKKSRNQKIKKNLSCETYNLGLGPTPKLSTRISKDAVNRNKQKDSKIKFRGSKSPPPPRSRCLGSEKIMWKAGILKNSHSEGL